MNHELKVEPHLFNRIVDGSKKFIYVEDEFGFQTGDTVTLKEYDYSPQNSTTNSPKGFTDSKPLDFRIGYIQHLGNRVILSLLPLEKKRERSSEPKK